MITWLSACSPRPKTATDVNVTCRLFGMLVGDIGNFCSLTSVRRPFHFLTAPSAVSLAHARRVSLAGISVASPLGAPRSGVPGGAVGDFGSIVFRNWFRNLIRTVTVTPLSPLRVIAYCGFKAYFFAVACPPADSLLYSVSVIVGSLIATRWATGRTRPVVARLPTARWRASTWPRDRRRRDGVAGSPLTGVRASCQAAAAGLAAPVTSDRGATSDRAASSPPARCADSNSGMPEP